MATSFSGRRNRRLCKLQNRCTQLTAATDKVYQLPAYGRWFSAGTPVSSTTKTGRHDIAEMLLKHYKSSTQRVGPHTPEFRTLLFPHLLPPAIMVWIFIWKYIFEPFIHILQHFVLQLII
jgi:hypothetical protein